MQQKQRFILSPSEVEREGIILEGEPAYVRKSHGAMIGGGYDIGSTLQCPHCGGHFLSVKGSGARRTFCFKCMGVTCGQRGCDPCIPWERKFT